VTDATTITIHPRYSDFDRDGLLQTANYVRFTRQAAIEAGAAMDLKGYGLEARGWLEHVGDVGVQVSEPIVFGDVVEVETRLASSGPPVWRREFTFKRADSGAQLARGFVDAYETDDEDDESDDELDEDFEAAEDVANDAWDTPMPSPPAPSDGAFRSNWRVGPQDLDLSGFLDPASLTEAAADMHSRASGLQGWGAQHTLEAGIYWIAIEHRLELFEPIELDDLLGFTSYIGEVGTDYVDWHSTVERERNIDEIARARVRWACMSAETGQRCPIPEDWLLDMAGLMSERE
jgi:acyl-CoA thioesterase FadM